MKKAIISLFLLSSILISCSDPGQFVLANDEESVTVTLKLTGDYGLEVTQDPLTKTTFNDAYGINVFWDKEGDSVTDDVFAYGLFDNVAAMSIKLLSGHKYRFACTLIKDAKNTIYFGQAFGNAYSGYAYPFQTNVSGSTQLDNQFHITTDDGTTLGNIGYGITHLKSVSNPTSSNAVDYASVNRFYGETDQYVPVVNGTVEIYLKRVVFGAKFVY